jgi:hypothetical protein
MYGTIDRIGLVVLLMGIPLLVAMNDQKGGWLRNYSHRWM